MGILTWIIVGLISGVVAQRLLQGQRRLGLFLSMALGIAGAIVGGIIASVLLDAHPLDGFFDLSTWVASIGGSVLMLAGWRALKS